MFRHHRTSLISNRSFVSDLRIYRPSRVSSFYLQTITLFKVDSAVGDDVTNGSDLFRNVSKSCSL